MNAVIKILRSLWVASLLFSLIVDSANACMTSQELPFNYYFNPNDGSLGLFYDGMGGMNYRPTVVDGCKEAVGQFLMVALTVRTQKPNGKSADLSFTDHYTPDLCRIKNNPFPNSPTPNEKSKTFLNQYRFLRSCTFYDVRDLEGRPLFEPDVQPAAKAERVSADHIRFFGDFFYLRIQKENRFGISIGLRRECADPTFLRDHDLNPGEVQALLNTYIAGDASGVTTDLTAVGSSKARFLLSPLADPLSPQRSLGAEGPIWPRRWKSGIEFGSLGIKLLKDGRSKMDFQLLVDHFGDADSSYLNPMAGQLELLDLSSARKRVIDSWYFGDVVPPQYQGFLVGVPRILQSRLLQVGKRYRLQMSFSNPNEDFRLFRSGFKQMLIDLGSLIGMPGLDVIEVLNGLTGMAPGRSLSGLDDLSGTDASQSIQDSMRDLDVLSKQASWPPDYAEACLQDESHCITPGRSKWFKRMGIEFNLQSVGLDDSYVLSSIKIWSEDPFNGYKEYSSDHIPTLDCSAESKTK